MMNECSLLSDCKFFNNLFLMNSPLAEDIKKSFCLKNFEKCARYQLQLYIRRDLIPENLYPTQNEKVQDLIEKFQGLS